MPHFFPTGLAISSGRKTISANKRRVPTALAVQVVHRIIVEKFPLNIIGQIIVKFSILEELFEKYLF